MAERIGESPTGRRLGPAAKIAIIIRREFLERVKTKAFIISTILVPVLLGGVMFAPLLLDRIIPDEPLTLAVVDETDVLFEDLDAALASSPEEDFLKPSGSSSGGQGMVRRYQLEPVDEELSEELLDRLSERVEERSLDAYLVVPRAILEGEEEPRYYGRTLSDDKALRRIRRAFTETMIARRLAAEGVDPGKTAELTRSVGLDTVKIGAKGERRRRGVAEELIVMIVYTMFIYANIIFYGSALARSLIEEKMNRVAEVLLSSVTPFQLMAGKIIGIGAVGLAQFLIWVGAAMAFYAFRGISPESQDLFSAIQPAVLGYFVLFFVLGYFLYASLFGMVGAMCTSEQEAQNTQTPVLFLVVAAFILGISLIRNPESSLTVAVSHFPFFSPIVMFMRIQSLTPPAWEIAINVLAILAFIAGTAWLAGRIFRVGILMTGKKPTIPELVRWVRTS